MTTPKPKPKLIERIEFPRTVPCCGEELSVLTLAIAIRKNRALSRDCKRLLNVLALRRLVETQDKVTLTRVELDAILIGNLRYDDPRATRYASKAALAAYGGLFDLQDPVFTLQNAAIVTVVGALAAIEGVPEQLLVVSDIRDAFDE